MSNVLRIHEIESKNNRAVRLGNDPRFITGYHELWHGFQLTGEKSKHDTDIAVAPLDAPEFFPAGCCESRTTSCGTICAAQASVWRS